MASFNESSLFCALPWGGETEDKNRPLFDKVLGASQTFGEISFQKPLLNRLHKVPAPAGDFPKEKEKETLNPKAPSPALAGFERISCGNFPAENSRPEKGTGINRHPPLTFGPDVKMVAKVL